MTFLDAAPLVALAGAGLAAYKRKAALAIGCAAAAGGLWWWNRYQQARLVPAGSTLLPSLPAGQAYAISPYAQLPAIPAPPPPAPGSAPSSDVIAASANLRNAIAAQASAYQQAGRSDLAAETLTNMGRGHF